MKLIDKDVLVEEIERRKKKNLLNEGAFEEDIDLLSFINTLEVKEVDLEPNSFDATVCKIGNTYLKEMDKDAIAKVLESYKNGDKVKVVIKAQKGE